jgi:hypothetical protein
MNFDIQKINKHAKAADTDSMFICFEPIIKKLYPDKDIYSKEECLPIAKQLQSELRPILNSYQTILAKNILNSDEHYFDLKPEFILQSAYWSGKRRYAQLLVDQEGREIEKLVVMGLDIMKSNFPEYFRGFGEQLIRKILFNTPKKEIDKFLTDFRDSINEVDWKKLIKPTGVKKMDEYIASPPPKGKIFSILGKKCPINTKSSIRTNDLIIYHGLDKEHSQIQIGDKVYIVYLKKNPYMIDSVALTGYNDPQVIVDLVEEYIDRDKLFEAVIQKKIETIYHDVWKSQPVFNTIINDYFNFG